MITFQDGVGGEWVGNGDGSYAADNPYRIKKTLSTPKTPDIIRCRVLHN